MSVFERTYFLVKDVVKLQSPRETAKHMREGIGWLTRAQDATSDRGVSHSYLVGTGWMRSYPETTGYIIPTLLNWATLTGDSEARRRALEMADWELTVQMQNGAIPSLSDGSPVVFDTGQVLFGWVSAYKTTGDERYLNAATKAATWLVDNLDRAGTWSSYGNPGSDHLHTYNVRVAWAVLAFAEMTGDTACRDAMCPFLDWVLKQETGRGWFAHNCLNDNEHPLLHTIAYTSQGLLECGLLLNDTRCIEAAGRTSDELVRHVGTYGRMPGRFDARWNGVANWSCLTGMAQTAIVWQRLDRMHGDNRFAEATEAVLRFLKRTQDLATGNPGVRGGIKGSFPLNGGYCTWRLPNWATKFFIDALLLEQHPNLNLSLY